MRGEIYEEFDLDATAAVGDSIIKENLEKNKMSKPWYTSKTVGFNIVVFLVAFLALPEFVQLLPVSALPYITLGGVVGNLILRVFFTGEGLTLK